MIQEQETVKFWNNKFIELNIISNGNVKKNLRRILDKNNLLEKFENDEKNFSASKAFIYCCKTNDIPDNHLCPICGKIACFDRTRFRIHCSVSCSLKDKNVQKVYKENKQKIEQEYDTKYAEFIQQNIKNENLNIKQEIEFFHNLFLEKGILKNDEFSKWFKKQCIENLSEEELNRFFQVRLYFSNDNEIFYCLRFNDNPLNHVCPTCGKLIPFTREYLTFCSPKCSAMNPNTREEFYKSMIKSYGYEHALQNKSLLKKAHKKYSYKNENFDSSWELAVWVYYIDNNIKIVHEPLKLEYYENNGKKHYYYPDFQIENKIIEIKGDYLLNKDKNGFTNFYNKKDSNVQKATWDCMIKNNIEVWSYKKIKFFLSYVKNKYGRNYLNQFKNF